MTMMKIILCDRCRGFGISLCLPSKDVEPCKKCTGSGRIKQTIKEEPYFDNIKFTQETITSIRSLKEHGMISSSEVDDILYNLNKLSDNGYDG